ncbi:MAG: hypothetical protein ACO1NW_07770 [Chitinophagaceae bacterium]
MNFTTLPKKKADAQKKFRELLDVPENIIVLIFGTDETAENACGYAQEMVEAAHPDYSFVEFVFVETIEAVTEVLMELETAETVNMDKLDESVALSISPGSHIIAYLLSKARFNYAPGYMNRAILAAMANA